MTDISTRNAGPAVQSPSKDGAIGWRVHVQHGERCLGDAVVCDYDPPTGVVCLNTLKIRRQFCRGLCPECGASYRHAAGTGSDLLPGEQHEECLADKFFADIHNSQTCCTELCLLTL